MHFSRLQPCASRAPPYHTTLQCAKPRIQALPVQKFQPPVGGISPLTPRDPHNKRTNRYTMLATEHTEATPYDAPIVAPQHNLIAALFRAQLRAPTFSNHNPKFNSKLMAHETFKNPTIVAERTQPTASERGQDGTEPNQTPYAIDSAQTVPVPRPKIPEGGEKKVKPQTF